MRHDVLLLVLFGVIMQSESRHLERCQLVRELRAHGFPEYQLSNWVCLVEHESNSNTHVVGSLNGDGSKDFGLFQISDKYWCNNAGWPGKQCHVTCNELLSDDISAAAKCAKKVFKHHGFQGWYGWIAHCQGHLPDISYC